MTSPEPDPKSPAQLPDGPAASPQPFARAFSDPLAARRHPRFSIVTALIVANVAVYYLAHLGPQWYNRIYPLGMLEIIPVWKGQVWRLLTAQYLHANPLHLFVNMIALHFLGRPLEDRWSIRRFLAVYTACGLAGNLFYVLLGLRGVIDPRMPAVGASGCLYGLLGIVAVLYPHARVYLFFVLPVQIRGAAVVLGLIAFMSVIERGGNYGGEACHLAGLGFGLWWALHGEQWWDSTEWVFSGRRQN